MKAPISLRFQPLATCAASRATRARQRAANLDDVHRDVFASGGKPDKIFIAFACGDGGWVGY